MQTTRIVLGLVLVVLGLPRIAPAIAQVRQTAGDPEMIGRATAAIALTTAGSWLIFAKPKRNQAE